MREVKNYLNNRIENNSSIVVACSGGPDSMCLLNLLLEQKETKNLKLICAHVNHKMRVESEEEALFVEEYCNKYGIVYEYMAITNYDNNNFHDQARIKRYNFFKELLKKYDAKYLMTAHHGDDLIETILMRIVRGSNISGYSGFQKENNYVDYLLIRPLINVTKKEIEQYNLENSIPYVIDQSNEKDKYTRNRYRHKILPFLKEEDNDVHKKFLKFSKELNSLNVFLTNYMSNILTEIIKDDTLDLSLFGNLDEFIKRKVIESMIDKIQEDNILYIEDKHIDAIIDLIKNNKSNVSIDLPNGFIAEKSYNEFKIKKAKNANNYFLKLDKEIKLSNGFVIKEVENTDDNSNFILRLSSEEITFPLYVRNRLDGDKIEVKNLNGHKKVKDIMIDSKIPVDRRDCWPVLVDSKNQILWLPGLKKSKFDKKNSEKYDIIIRYEEDKNE